MRNLPILDFFRPIRVKNVAKLTEKKIFDLILMSTTLNKLAHNISQEK